MNENEIMMNEEVIENPEIIEEEGNGNNLGLGILIGSGLTLAGIAIVKKGKVVYSKLKERRRMSKPKDARFEVIDEDIEDVGDETE